MVTQHAVMEAVVAIRCGFGLSMTGCTAHYVPIDILHCLFAAHELQSFKQVCDADKRAMQSCCVAYM